MRTIKSYLPSKSTDWLKPLSKKEQIAVKLYLSTKAVEWLNLYQEASHLAERLWEIKAPTNTQIKAQKRVNRRLQTYMFYSNERMRLG